MGTGRVWMGTMARRPFVSVILAVRNERAYIASCLTAVLAQDYPAEACEIIVADGASDDGTPEIIRSRPGAAERVTIITNPQRIQAAGLNAAIRQAQGDIIVRVDGHTIIAPDYVRCCVALLAETGAATVGGRMLCIGVTPMGKAIAAAGQSVFAVPTAFHVSDRAQFTDTVYMGAWAQSTLERVGGFDEQLLANEDYELNYRIRRAGGRIYLAPALVSSYYCRQKLGALAQQYFRYGVGKAQMLTKHPAALRWRQLVPPIFLLALIVLGALSPVNQVPRVLLITMLVAYAALAVVFSATAAAKSSRMLLLRVPLVYTTMHISWGAGFWAGLMREMMRARRGKSSSAMPSLRRGTITVQGSGSGYGETHGITHKG